MSNEVEVNTTKIDVGDLIKLSHFDVLDPLIKKTADDLLESKEWDKKEFNVDMFIEALSNNYKELISDVFSKRYESTVQNQFGLISQLTSQIHER